MIFRFIVSNGFINLDTYTIPLFDKNIHLNKVIVEVFFVIITLVISFVLYKITIKYLLSGYERSLVRGGKGEDFSIREIKVLSVNDYSFFLLTLLLPLVSLDHSSFINLSISLLIIFYVISIYVKTDAISVCPLFFFSGRKVYKGIISTGTKEQEAENPLLRKEVIIIMKEKNLTLNRKMRGEELVGNVFYLSKIETKDDNNQY
jgi:hypothetical protein